MSYLELPAGISDCAKAVISLWFRVPDETLQAVLALPDDPAAVDDNFGIFIPPLHKVIPLITFGSVESAFAGPAPISPSYVGVDCNSGQGVLAANLQMSNSTTFSSEPAFIEDQLRPDAFYMVGSGAGDSLLEVTADHWHHVLISFDLSLGCSCYFPTGDVLSFLPPFQITPGPKFTWAFDDLPRVDELMGPSGGAIYVSPPGSDVPMAPIPPDSIIPSYLTGLVGAFEGITSSWSPVPLHMEHSIATPTAAQFVASVHPVELAELQFFAGVAMDVRTEDNRRAFIDDDGQPVPPVPPLIDNPDYDSDLPESAANPKLIPDPDGSPAQKLLGQPPDILLHGDSNWIAGKNTGPMIPNPDYDPDLPEGPTNPALIPDPDKQFTPTGKIVAYTPDPSLHGPQSPAARMRVAA